MKTMRGKSDKRVLWYCVVVVLAGLLAGCATTSETSTLQENLSIINQREAALEKRLQGTEGAARRSGDLYTQLQELQDQIRRLNGRLDEVSHKVEQIQQNQAAAPQPQAPQQPQVQPQPQSQAPGMPPSGTVVMEPPPSRQQPRTEAPRPAPPRSSGQEGYAPPERERQSRARPEPAPGRSPEQVEFDKGVQLMQQRSYDAAKKVFQRFSSKYPDSGLQESAMYNIGECCFGERHYEDAIKAYQAVVDRYPKGGRTAGALLKEGIGWQEIGEATMARIIFTRLVTNYPGTAQAKAAEKKLKKM